MSFRILESQMLALGRETQRAFCQKMERYLRENLPAFVNRIGEQRLERWVDDAVAVAHAHDIDTEPEVAQLMLLLTVLGVDADRKHAWVGEIVANDALLPSGKLVALCVEGGRRVPEIAPVVVFPEYVDALRRNSEEPS